MTHHQKTFFSLALLLALVLCGCAAKVQLAGGVVKDNIESIVAVVTPEDLTLLGDFKKLVSADFSGSSCYAELRDWVEQHPLVETTYTVPFPGGVVADNHTRDLDLTGLQDQEAEEALEKLAYLPQLKAVDLGDQIDHKTPLHIIIQKRIGEPPLIAAVLTVEPEQFA